MRLYIGSDHAGAKLKSKLIPRLRTELASYHFDIVDFGPASDSSSVDYPTFAKRLCEHLTLKERKLEPHEAPNAFGILICGSGHGMAMTANKFSAIRAAWVHNEESARLARQHNNANVIVFGSKFVNTSRALTAAIAFLFEPFQQELRHVRRVQQIHTGRP